MPSVSKYTAEDRKTALALVFRIGTIKTSKELNIPQRIISKWKREEVQRRRAIGIETRVINAANSTETQMVMNETVHAVVSQQVKAIIAEESDSIRHMVRSELAHTIQTITTDLLQITGDALIEAQRMINEEGQGKSSNAEWLRSVAGVIDKGVQLHQILTGKAGLPGENGLVPPGGVIDRLEKYVVVYRDLEARHRVLPSGNASDNPGEPLDPDQSGA